MEKINFEKYINRESTIEEVVQDFLVQLVEEEQAQRNSSLPEDLRQRNMEIAVKTFKKNIVVKEIMLQDDLEYHVYAACSQPQIDKLLAFEEGYVIFEKETKKIKKQGEWTAPVKFDAYHVKYDEDLAVVFHLARGGELEKKYLIAEDELDLIKLALTQSAYDQQEGIMR